MADELYGQYLEAVYKQANALTLREFERAIVAFRGMYGCYLPQNKNAKILDIGCGGGHFLYFLEKDGYVNYEGIDISPQQVGFCRAHVTPRVVQADALDFLDGKDRMYELIVAFDVLEHQTRDKALALLAKIYAALKDGGVLIVRVPNMSNPLSAHGRYIDLTHELGFTERSLYQALFLGGFRQIEIKGGLLLRKRTLRAFLRRIFLGTYYGWVRFLYYVQDFSVPRILDHDLVGICRKAVETS